MAEVQVPDELRNFFSENSDVVQDPFLPVGGTNVPQPITLPGQMAPQAQPLTIRPEPMAEPQPLPATPMRDMGTATLGQMGQYQPIMPTTPNLVPPVAPPPIQDGVTLRAPSGGTATVPGQITLGDQSIITPAELERRVEASRIARELQGATPSGFIAEKAAGMEDAQAKAKVRSITKNLESRGMSRDEIARKIGYTEGMTSKDALSAIQRLQKESGKAIKGSDEMKKRTRDRLLQNADWGEGEEGERIPQNPAARGSVIQDRLDSLGPDPQNEDKSLYDTLNKSDQRRMDRIIQSMSTNSKRTEGDEKWAENKLKAAEDKRERAFNKAQDDEKKKALRLAEKRADTDQKRNWFNAVTDELDKVEERIKAYDEASKPEMIMTEEEYQQHLSRRGQILGQIREFNEGVFQGFQAGAEVGSEMVPMIAPDGRRLNVPAARVEDLEAKGARRA